LPSGPTENYTYDAIYQLTQVAQAGPATTESYAYDGVGNRTASLGVSPWSYNSSNQLTSIAGSPGTTFTYDNNGNTLTKVDAAGTTTYAWDFENRLTSVALPGSGGTVSFTYDPLGRRIQKSSATGTSIYAYDRDNQAEEVDAAGAVVARYGFGVGIDEPLAMLRSGVSSFYQADGLGSVTSLTDSAGAIAAIYTYDSFGNLAASTGSVVNPFRYTAREWDSETGLHYYRARYYGQGIGRFASEDPLGFAGDTANFYAYVVNSPANLIDPLGLQSGVAAPPAPPPSAPPLPRTYPAPGVRPTPPNPSVTPRRITRIGVRAIGIGIAIVLDLMLADPTARDEDNLHRTNYPHGMPKAPPCKTREECEEEWEVARRDCREYLSLPNPPRALVGSRGGRPYRTVEECARGHVTEECGGNPIDWGDYQPPQRRPRR